MSGQAWFEEWSQKDKSTWPPWVHGKMKTCAPEVTGAAAVAVHMSSLGLPLGRGAATAEAAAALHAQHGLLPRCRLPAPSRRHAVAAALAALPALCPDAPPGPAEDIALVADSGGGEGPPTVLLPEDVAAVCGEVLDAADEAVAAPPPTRLLATVDVVCENPQNALWVLLLEHHPEFFKTFLMRCTSCAPPTQPTTGSPFGHTPCARMADWSLHTPLAWQIASGQRGATDLHGPWGGS